VLWISEGDALTRFFHVHANSRRRWHCIHTLEHQGHVLVARDQKTLTVYDFFKDILGVPLKRVNSLNLDLLDLPSAELGGLDEHFTESEILAIIRSLPPNKAPGPGGFMGRFFQSTWEIIWGDIMAAFDAFWHKDLRNLSLINNDLLMLIPKLTEAKVRQRLSPNLFDPLLQKAFLQGASDEVGAETTIPCTRVTEHVH
jgi:hypothetical protein